MSETNMNMGSPKKNTPPTCCNMSIDEPDDMLEQERRDEGFWQVSEEFFKQSPGTLHIQGGDLRERSERTIMSHKGKDPTEGTPKQDKHALGKPLAR